MRSVNLKERVRFDTWWSGSGLESHAAVGVDSRAIAMSAWEAATGAKIRAELPTLTRVTRADRQKVVATWRGGK